MEEGNSVERESFVEVPGGEVFVKTWSPPDVAGTAPLFLLHDSLGCVALWRDFPLLLSERLGKTVIAYDRLGFGRSSARTELPSVDFIEEEAQLHFPALLQALDVERFDLFGHSVGGAMAVVCAAKIPGCRSVVTEAAQAYVEPRTLESISRVSVEFREPENFGRLVKYHGSNARWVLRAWSETWLSPGFADWSLAPLLPDVRCPVLAIHGDSDEYGSTAFPETIRSLAGGKSEMRILPDCGHVPHREKPGLILELLRGFYRDL